MNRRGVLFLGLYIVVCLGQLRQWLECKSFADVFHFSTAVVGFHLEEFVHNDNNLPRIVGRAFHNKITVYIPDVINTYLQFWNISFLIALITFIGVVGFCLGLYFLILNGKKQVYSSLLGVILLLPFVEVFLSSHLSYTFRLLVYWVLLQSVACYGFYNFLLKNKSKKYLYGLALLIFISIVWMVAFTNQIFTYCVKL